MHAKALALLSIIVAAICFPVAATAGDVLTMDAAVTTALAGNPELAAAGYASDAAFARPSQAATPPDPQFMVQFGQVPIDTIDVSQGTITYMVQQQIPFPSKLVYGYKAEKRAAEAAQFAQAGTSQELVRQVKVAYLNLWRLQEEESIQRQTFAIYQQSKGSAEASYAALESSISDPVRASVDLGDVEAELTILEQRRVEAAARLSALMNEPLDPNVRVARPKELPHTAALPTLVEKAKEARPEIEASDKMVASQQAKVALAKSQYGPDLTLRWGYDDRPNQQNAWTGRFMLSVPLWAFSKQRFGVRESKAMLYRAESMRDNTVLQTEAQTTSAHAVLVAAKKRVGIYAGRIVPRAEQLLSSSREAYQSGKGDFLSVVDSIRSLNRSRIDRVRAEFDAQKAYADLERAIGSIPTEGKL
jgi:outer membrane protein TolC